MKSTAEHSVYRVKLRRLTIVLSSAILVIIVLSILHLDTDQRYLSNYKVSETGQSRYLQIVDDNYDRQLSEDVSKDNENDGQVVQRHYGSFRNVFFLKAHKCASSTVQNILMRYGQKRSLNFVIPPHGNYLGVPDLLDVATQALPLSGSNLNASSSADSRSVYNILCHHCRYNDKSVRESMPPDTVRLAIVRDPVDLFESLYSYCNLADFYGMSIEKFASMPRHYCSTLARVHDVIGCNQMAFDFGISAGHLDGASKIGEAMRLLDEQFHLVMVAEHFDESIVLMKNLLELDVQDVVYFTKNKRFTEEKQNLTDNVRNRIRDANWMDQMIYDHFVGVLTRKVREFGEERMRAEVDELRRWNRHWYRTCGVRSSSHDDDERSLPTTFREINSKVRSLTLDTDRLIRNRNDRAEIEFCEMLAITEFPFTIRLRSMHIKRHGNWWQKFLLSMGFYE